jgi:Co/Zn/Cd efflux system component
VASLIWAIVAVLVLLWLLAVATKIGGSLVFLLLVLAVIGVIYNLFASSMFGRTRHHHHATEVTHVTEVEHRDV